MSHRNEGRDERRNSAHPHRQEAHQTAATTPRTQHISSSSRYHMDRYTLPGNQPRSGGYGKYFEFIH